MSSQATVDRVAGPAGSWAVARCRAIAAPEPWLTIEQTAGLLQVSSKTIRRHIWDGRLIAHRIGTQWRIAGCDLDLYLRDARRGH